KQTSASGKWRAATTSCAEGPRTRAVVFWPWKLHRSSVGSANGRLVGDSAPAAVAGKPGDILPVQVDPINAFTAGAGLTGECARKLSPQMWEKSYRMRCGSSP